MRIVGLQLRMVPLMPLGGAVSCGLLISPPNNLKGIAIAPGVATCALTAHFLAWYRLLAVLREEENLGDVWMSPLKPVSLNGGEMIADNFPL